MNDHIEVARSVIDIESQAVARLSDRVDDAFNDAVQIVLSCRGKVVVSGVGKSGLVSRKIAATLSSTGTPAIFLHPADALHGDMGIIGSEDVLVLISNSGSTDELLKLIEAIKDKSVRSIAIVGNAQSSLALAADAVLDAAIEKEACPLGLTPTASTAVAMAWGDCLAMALLSARGFDKEHFAASHPAGALGARLYRQVHELMHSGEQLPLVDTSAQLPHILAEMNQAGYGVAIVTERDGSLAGIITDGDLRRLFSQGEDLDEVTAANFQSHNPHTVLSSASAMEAMRVMETAQITALIVINDEGYPIGLIHIHDILGRSQIWK